MPDADAARSLFERALNRSMEEREAFVRAEAGSDKALIAEVLALLKHVGEGTTQTGPLRQERPVEAPEQRRELCEVPESLPKCIGSIEIVRAIGKGGMGRVFLGRDPMLNRMVAVKMLDVLPIAKASELVAGLKEGTAAVIGVKHPGLIETYAANIHEGVPYLVMEYVPGRTLAGRIKEDGALPIRDALRIAIEIAAATGALHRMGVVHKDLKPSNVMFDHDGRTRVMDYGLAGAAAGESDRVSGTPRYMAPEMFTGASSPRSDVYAIGIVFFEMLAGRPPYTGALGELATMHEAGELPFDQINACPDTVREVIERATRPDVLFRIKDADRLHAALERALKEVDVARVSSGREPGTGVAGTDAAGPGVPDTDGGSGSTSLDTTRQRVAEVRAGLVSSAALEPIEGPRGTLTTGAIVRCVNCSYWLDGLPIFTNCPECGAPVGFSIDPRLRRLKDDAISLPLGLRAFLVFLFAGVGIFFASAAGIVYALSSGRFDEHFQPYPAIAWRAVTMLVLFPLVYQALKRGQYGFDRRLVAFRPKRSGRIGPIVLATVFVAPIDGGAFGLATSFENSTAFLLFATSPVFWLYLLMPFAMFRVASGLGLGAVRYTARIALIGIFVMIVFNLVRLGMSYFELSAAEIFELKRLDPSRFEGVGAPRPAPIGVIMAVPILIGIAGALGLLVARIVSWARVVELGIVTLTIVGVLVVTPTVVNLRYSLESYDPFVAFFGFTVAIWITSSILVLQLLIEITRLSPYERAQRLSAGDTTGIKLGPINAEGGPELDDGYTPGELTRW